MNERYERNTYKFRHILLTFIRHYTQFFREVGELREMVETKRKI